MQTAKYLLKKSANSAKALLAYRAAPLGHGKSPAELQFGRRLRTDLPTIPEWPGLDEFKADKAQRNRKQKNYFDATDLRALVRGQRVWVVDQKKQAIVNIRAGSCFWLDDRLFLVDKEYGWLTKRNRRSSSQKQLPALMLLRHHLDQYIATVHPPGPLQRQSRDNWGACRHQHRLNVTDSDYSTRSGNAVVPSTKLDL